MTAPCRSPWSTCTRAREVGTVVPSTEKETEAQTGVATCQQPPSQQAGPQLSPQTCLSHPHRCGTHPLGPCRVAPRGERGENGHVTWVWEWGSLGTKLAPSLAQKAGCPPHPDMGSHLPKPRDYRGPHCGICHTDHAHEHARVCTRMHNVHTYTAHALHATHLCRHAMHNTYVQTNAHVHP